MNIQRINLHNQTVLIRINAGTIGRIQISRLIRTTTTTTIVVVVVTVVTITATIPTITVGMQIRIIIATLIAIIAISMKKNHKNITQQQHSPKTHFNTTILAMKQIKLSINFNKQRL